MCIRDRGAVVKKKRVDGPIAFKTKMIQPLAPPAPPAATSVSNTVHPAQGSGNGNTTAVSYTHLDVYKRQRLTGLAFGVVPKYQALGVDSYLIYAAGLFLQGKGWYEQYEMGWAGDWNPKMVNIYKSLGGTQSRRMVTFRYIFNEKYPFERHPEMDYK